MPTSDEYIRIMMNGREVIKISRSGHTYMSKDIDWTKADSYFWEAIVKTICKEIAQQRHQTVTLEQILEERSRVIDDLVEKNRRLRGLPDGTEDEMLDRWSGILDEG